MRVKIALVSYFLAAGIIVAIPILSRSLDVSGRADDPLPAVSTNRDDTAPGPETKAPTAVTTAPVTTASVTTASVTTAPVDSDSPDIRTVKVCFKPSGEVREIDLEDYVKGAVMAEMPWDFDIEALKAQAVAARTFCLYKEAYGDSSHPAASVCTDYSHCAAYISDSDAKLRWGEKNFAEIDKKISLAVSETAGIVMTYDGKPIAAAFHSRSYKYTESAKDIWGYDVPYLTSVSSPEEDVSSYVEVTDSELRSLLDESGEVSAVKLSSAENIGLQRSVGGRVKYLYYGTRRISGSDLRRALSLKSCSVDVTPSEKGWLFTVHGSGHGVGMSQYGAQALALQGYDYAYILAHYYSGIALGRA